ncbi:hypothetical protein D3C71_2210290 [compost metagenome]
MHSTSIQNSTFWPPLYFSAGGILSCSPLTRAGTFLSHSTSRSLMMFNCQKRKNISRKPKAMTRPM